MTKRFLTLIVLGVLLLGNVAYADMVMMQLPVISVKANIIPVTVSFAVDLLVIAVVLKYLGFIKEYSGKLLLYYAVAVFVVGMLSDFIGSASTSIITAIFDLNTVPDSAMVGMGEIESRRAALHSYYEKFEIVGLYPNFIFMIITGIVLFFNNKALAERFLKKDKRVCYIMAAALAVFTNPIIGVLLGLTDTYHFRF